MPGEVEALSHNLTQVFTAVSDLMVRLNLLEAARIGVDNLSHCVTAVCWVYGQPVALAAHVGQAASEATVLAA